MRIMLIDVNCMSGSTGKIVYELYSKLVEDGYNVAICYGRGAAINEANIYKFGIDLETEMHAILTRITGFTGCFSFFSTNRLIRYIEKFQPDVVHIHELHGYFVNMGRLVRYLKKHKIKIVWTFHCEFMYTGRCGISNDCEKWKNGCGNCLHLKEYPSTLFFDFSAKMLKQKSKMLSGLQDLTIVTPSKWLADRVKSSILYDKRIIVVTNGIETKTIFYPRDYTILKHRHSLITEKVILSVGPKIMGEGKGGRWILQLANLMRSQKIKFIIIGDESPFDMDLPNVVVLPHTSDQNQLAAYYSMADVFLQTSKRETFSLVCVEALACGTPIVGFECGAPETIIPSNLGTFVPYGDIQKLKDAVEVQLYKEKPIHECRKYAEENFDNTGMYMKYKKIYNGEN